MLKKSVFLLIGLLLVSCAPGATQTAAPQPAETQPAVTAEPVATTPPAQETDPTAGGPDAPGLSGQVWYLESYLDAQGALAALLPGSQVTAEFSPDGQVSGTSGCNNYSGGYELDGDQIKFSPLASTMMACIEPAGLMEQEAAYLQNLGKAASIRLADGKLEMLDAARLAILVFSATPPAAVAPLPAQPAEIPASISLEGLKNGVYLTEFTTSGTAELKDGVYAEPAASDSEAQNTVTLLADLIAYGLLPDGQTAAAVVLEVNTGGSGIFYQLSLMVDASGQAVNLASTFLGDRVMIHQVSFEEGKILVDLTTQGPQDAMCCPTLRMLEVYAYQDGELVKVSSVELAQPTLTGVVWQWQEFQSSDESLVKPENPESYTIEFLPDGKLSIQADCNRVMGAYTVDGSMLTIDARAMTMMACPPGSLSTEFVEYLNNVVSYVFEDGNLFLALKFDSGIMKLSAPGQAGEGLTGVVWRWEEFQSSDGSVVKPENPETYTLEFLPDGAVSIQADCNRVVGIYTVDGSVLTIQAQAMTLMACPPGSLSDKYIEYLNNVVSYVFEGENLFLALKFDSGIMKFTP